jgi:hypothetical protein
MVEWDQPIVDVCMNTRGQKMRMPEVDMPSKKLLKREVSPTKGR